jgi:hypothetical protein
MPRLGAAEKEEMTSRNDKNYVDSAMQSSELGSWPFITCERR